MGIHHPARPIISRNTNGFKSSAGIINFTPAVRRIRSPVPRRTQASNHAFTASAENHSGADAARQIPPIRQQQSPRRPIPIHKDLACIPDDRPVRALIASSPARSSLRGIRSRQSTRAGLRNAAVIPAGKWTADICISISSMQSTTNDAPASYTVWYRNLQSSSTKTKFPRRGMHSPITRSRSNRNTPANRAALPYSPRPSAARGSSLTSHARRLQRLTADPCSRRVFPATRSARNLNIAVDADDDGSLRSWGLKSNSAVWLAGAPAVANRRAATRQRPSYFRHSDTPAMSGVSCQTGAANRRR